MHAALPVSSLLKPVPRPPQLERARGAARVAVRADGSVTRLYENYQSGSAKVRFPRQRAGGPLEAVLINTAGGLTGGDRLTYAVAAGANASCIATTQAAERIYRRSSDIARIETTLTVGDGGTLHWLPQETILFDRSALARTLTADVERSGRLLAVESIVLGRTAMGEAARDVIVADSWRIRRCGRLVFADGLRLDGDAVATMTGGATGNGAVALATLVLIAADAEAWLEPARAALDGANFDGVGGEGGVSAWNGMLTARLIAKNGQALRADLIRLIETLRGEPMPRVWNC